MKIERAGLARRRAIALPDLVPIAAGLAGIVFGPAMPGANELPALPDRYGYYRYLSGLLLAIGLGFWTAIPPNEHYTAFCRLPDAIVTVCGIGRLIGLSVTGVPTAATLAASVMVLVITPLLCPWQTQVSRTVPSTKR